jgi:hypothetical protein
MRSKVAAEAVNELLYFLQGSVETSHKCNCYLQSLDCGIYALQLIILLAEPPEELLITFLPWILGLNLPNQFHVLLTPRYHITLEL